MSAAGLTNIEKFIDRLTPALFIPLGFALAAAVLSLGH